MWDLNQTVWNINVTVNVAMYPKTKLLIETTIVIISPPFQLLPSCESGLSFYLTQISYTSLLIIFPFQIQIVFSENGNKILCWGFYQLEIRKVRGARFSVEPWEEKERKKGKRKVRCKLCLLGSKQVMYFGFVWVKNFEEENKKGVFRQEKVSQKHREFVKNQRKTSKHKTL